MCELERLGRDGVERELNKRKEEEGTLKESILMITHTSTRFVPSSADRRARPFTHQRR